MERPAKAFNDAAATLISGAAAGAAIGVGGWSYATLRVAAPLGAFYGALAFSLGIILVCVCGLMLYTGKIGYAMRDWLFAKEGEKTTPGYRAKTLALIFVGNVFGAFLAGLAAARLSPQATSDSIKAIVEAKAASDQADLMIRSVLCGALVYAGVDLYRRYKGVLGTSLVAACIAAFVLLGFDHCVANAFYWGGAVMEAGWVFPMKCVLMCAVGNSFGAILVDALSALVGMLRK